MLPDQVYNRRPNHNNTPESVTLIIANFVVFAVATQLFAACTKINSFYWIVLGLLALYNVYIVRKYREDFSKAQMIGYVVSLGILVLLFFLLRSRAQNC